MSTIFRVEKTSNYTVMSNYHMMDHSLSYKAKGILSEILSLPPTWDYTLAGLATLANDGIDSVRAGVHELENSGYINRKRTRDEHGRMSKNEYVVYERPEDNPEFITKQSKKAENPIQLKKEPKNKSKGNGYIMQNTPSLENPTMDTEQTDSPYLENPTMEKPTLDNPTLEKPTLEKPTLENPMTNKVFNKLNTKGLNTEYINHSNQSISQSANSKAEKIDKIDEKKISRYKNLIYGNIDYEELIAQNEDSKSRIDEIVDNMLEMMCCTSETMRIGGVDQPTALVQGRLMKIDSSCIEYILLCLHRNTTKVNNIKAYLKTVIFNAPSTMDNYFDSEVKYALYGSTGE